MCDCIHCGAFAVCDNPGCTNDECPDCREHREWQIQVNERDDEQGTTETIPEDGNGRR